MKFAMRVAGTALAVAALTGCGTINHHETAKQPLGKELNAGIGDVVLKLERHRDLENIAGKADMWGRKTNEGYTEVRFLGLEGLPSDSSRAWAKASVWAPTGWR